MGQMGSGASTRLFLSRSMIDIVEVYCAIFFAVQAV